MLVPDRRIIDYNLFVDKHLTMERRPRRLVTGLLTPSFLIAVVLLGSAAALSGPFARWMKIKQNKEALPLKSPLRAFNPGTLAPYRVVERFSLPPAVEDALGTNRYLNWSLEDVSVDPDDPLRRALLFVTYYSGGNDLVPHTPDVCYVGGGYQPAQPHENMGIKVLGVDSESRTIPVRVCTFAKTAVFDRERLSVVYTFHCNGEFVATRNDVRLRVNTLWNTYAYFSKVEVSFPGATREQTIEGSGKLLGRALPALIRDHWPDFEAAERRAREQVPGGEGLSNEPSRQET